MVDFPIALTDAVDNVTDVLAKHVNNIEAKIGIDGSAVTISHDYKLSEVTESAKALSTAAKATAAEVTTGTDDTKFVTPLALGGMDTKTHTLTNKRITKRTDTVASSATPAINTDTTDIFTITALAVAITSMSSGLTGTPTNGQTLIIRILDNATARAITWGASFASRGATLPTTTVLSKYSYVGFIYNSTASVWDCVAVVTET